MPVNTAKPTNAALPVNAAMPADTAMPVLLTSCEREIHIWKYGENELFCVRVANLLKNKYAIILGVIS